MATKVSRHWLTTQLCTQKIVSSLQVSLQELIMFSCSRSLSDILVQRKLRSSKEIQEFQVLLEFNVCLNSRTSFNQQGCRPAKCRKSDWLKQSVRDRDQPASCKLLSSTKVLIRLRALRSVCEKPQTTFMLNECIKIQICYFSGQFIELSVQGKPLI